MANQPVTDTSGLASRIESRISTDVAEGIKLGRNGVVRFDSMNQIMEFSKMMSLGGVAVPKHLRNNPGACMSLVIQAAAWQMDPFAVANKSYSVNDRMAYEAQMVNAVILSRAPITGRFKIQFGGEGDKRKCRVSAILEGTGEVVEYESPPFGLITPKNSPLWKGDPDQQLFYYSSRAMCRRHFPDVLLGVYAVDELEDQEPGRTAQGRVVNDNPLLRDTVPPVVDDYAWKGDDPQPETKAPEPEVQPEAQPEPEPQETGEPVHESPVEVSEETERADLLATIKNMLLENDSTVAKFAPICRQVGVLQQNVTIPAAPIEVLRVIAENGYAILIGEYQP